MTNNLFYIKCDTSDNVSCVTRFAQLSLATIFETPGLVAHVKPGKMAKQ